MPLFMDALSGIFGDGPCEPVAFHYHPGKWMWVQSETDRSKSSELSPFFSPDHKCFPSNYKYTPETSHVLKRETPLKVISTVQNSPTFPVTFRVGRPELIQRSFISRAPLLFCKDYFIWLNADSLWCKKLKSGWKLNIIDGREIVDLEAGRIVVRDGGKRRENQ